MEAGQQLHVNLPKAQLDPPVNLHVNMGNVSICKFNYFFLLNVLPIEDHQISPCLPEADMKKVRMSTKPGR